MTLASGPGCTPRSFASSIRSLKILRISDSICKSIVRFLSVGEIATLESLTMSIRFCAVGPRPHRAPSRLRATRSLAKVILARFQPLFSSPIKLCAGNRTSLKKTSLKLCCQVISVKGRISIPGKFIGQMKYEIPLCRVLVLGLVRARSTPNLAMCPKEVHTF